MEKGSRTVVLAIAFCACSCLLTYIAAVGLALGSSEPFSNSLRFAAVPVPIALLLSCLYLFVLLNSRRVEVFCLGVFVILAASPLLSVLIGLRFW